MLCTGYFLSPFKSNLFIWRGNFYPRNYYTVSYEPFYWGILILNVKWTVRHTAISIKLLLWLQLLSPQGHFINHTFRPNSAKNAMWQENLVHLQPIKKNYDSRRFGQWFLSLIKIISKIARIANFRRQRPSVFCLGSKIFRSS